MTFPRWIAPKEGYRKAWPERAYIHKLHEALYIALTVLNDVRKHTLDCDSYRYASGLLKGGCSCGAETIQETLKLIKELGDKT